MWIDYVWQGGTDVLSFLQAFAHFEFVFTYQILQFTSIFWHVLLFPQFQISSTIYSFARTFHFPLLQPFSAFSIFLRQHHAGILIWRPFGTIYQLSLFILTFLFFDSIFISSFNLPISFFSLISIVPISTFQLFLTISTAQSSSTTLRFLNSEISQISLFPSALSLFFLFLLSLFLNGSILFSLIHFTSLDEVIFILPQLHHTQLFQAIIIIFSFCALSHEALPLTSHLPCSEQTLQEEGGHAVDHPQAKKVYLLLYQFLMFQKLDQQVFQQSELMIYYLLAIFIHYPAIKQFSLFMQLISNNLLTFLFTFIFISVLLCVYLFQSDWQRISYLIYYRLQYLMIKSKRLKNFCEVCRKQCKDDNGYHCHLNSAHHQKKLRQLATNPHQHIQKYSNELQNRIIQILKSKYPGQAKDIQDIYEQYAEDKHHVKFNFTQWKDLSEFVQHLRNNAKNLKVVGKLPYCTVTYVVSKASDFMKHKKQQEAFTRKQKYKELEQKRVEERIARMRAAEAQRYKQFQDKMQKQGQDQEQQFDLDNQVFRFDFAQKTYQPSKLFSEQNQIATKQKQEQDNSKVKTNMQKLIEEIEYKDKKAKIKSEGTKIQQQQQFQWILPEIVVKVKPHDIPEVFHGKKAPILSIRQPFVAEIKLGNATLSIDQTNLETVIPKIGHQVKILKGPLRNRDGNLKQVSFEQGIGKIEVDGSIACMPFNEFSKTS